MRRAAAVILLFQVCTATPADPPPEQGQVEFRILGPDRRPLADTELQFFPLDNHARAFDGGSQTQRTDKDGIARLSLRAGSQRVRVFSRGIGYAITGSIDCTSDRTARVALTLVPFAVLEGSVLKNLLGREAVVHLSGHEIWSPLKSVKLDKDGRFRAEMPAGDWWVSLSRGNEILAQAPHLVTVAPGEKISDLTLTAVPPEQGPIDERDSVGAVPGRGQIVTWARGTVRDMAGRPIARAKVWALGVYFSGMRMEEWLKDTMTDAEGRYEIKGDGGLASLTMSLVAHVNGRPPAWGWTPRSSEAVYAPEGTPPPPVPPPPVVDLIVPDAGGKLEIAVVQDGKPAAGITVAIWNAWVNLNGERGVGHAQRIEEINAIVHPMARTNDAGVATFEHLVPGQYHALAGNYDQVQERLQYSSFLTPGTVGRAEGVPVVAGRTTSFGMTIYPQPNETRIQVLKANRQPLTDRHSFDYSATGAIFATSSSLILDASGVGRASFASAGLWRTAVTFQDSPLKWIPIRDLPFDRAEGIVAVSSLLPAKEFEPARFTARRYEPGSILVELRDAKDRPAQGFVQLDRLGTDPEFIGQTDEMGIVRFTGVPGFVDFDGKPSRPYVARAYAGRKPININDANSPLPSERQLTDQTIFLPQVVAAEPNTGKRVVLREEQAGYILGRVKPPAGFKPGGFYVTFLDDPFPVRGTLRQVANGEFVAGPFAPGTVTMRIWNTNESGFGIAIDAAKAEVKIEPGKVARVEFAPSAESVRRATRWRPTSPGHELQGRILLPDGQEPAFGTTVWCFVPGFRLPAVAGMADAHGQIRMKPVVDTGERPFSAPVDEFDEPVVVALLPGRNGAAILPAPHSNEAMKIVLRESRTIRGRVTVAGAAPNTVPGQIRILAAYDGRGSARLGRYLNVQTTAQADGSFEMAGLTPGRFQIQATLDGIWLSPSFAVDLNNRAPDELKLEIPAPGGPAVVRVIDGDGRPVPGRTLMLDRPSGPFAALWPRHWMTDGAGKVRVPALEAGRHTIRDAETDVTAEVEIPRLPAQNAFEVELRVKPSGRK